MPQGKHKGSKRGYKHKKVEPSVKIETVNIDNGDGTVTYGKIRSYKHGKTYGKKLATNRDRVIAGRIMKELREGKPKNVQSV